MNADMATARWSAMRGDVQQKWGRLSYSDLDQVGGQFSKLVSLVQDRYGYSSRRAQREVSRFLEQYGLNTGDVQEAAGSLMSGLQRKMSDYPLAFIAGAVLLALMLVGFVWKPFEH